MKNLETMTEPELRDYCIKCAKAIEAVAQIEGIERPLFCLVLFNDPKVAQYIGNCQRASMVEAMRETADRISKREDLPR